MKKVLINIILLFTFSISGMAQIEYGKTVEISKEVLLDKIKGGWAGQTIGCTYGGPTEFKYRGAIIHEKTPIIWYDDYCKDIFAEDPGLYDDVYMDLTFLEVMQKEGINASSYNHHTIPDLLQRCPCKNHLPKPLQMQITNYGMPTRQPDITYYTVLCHRHRDIGKIIRTLTILISRLKQTSLE